MPSASWGDSSVQQGAPWSLSRRSPTVPYNSSLRSASKHIACWGQHTEEWHLQQQNMTSHLFFSTRVATSITSAPKLPQGAVQKIHITTTTLARHSSPYSPHSYSIEKSNWRSVALGKRTQTNAPNKSYPANSPSSPIVHSSSEDIACSPHCLRLLWRSEMSW